MEVALSGAYTEPSAVSDANKGLSLLPAVAVLIVPYINVKTVLNVFGSKSDADNSNYKKQCAGKYELFL